MTRSAAQPHVSFSEAQNQLDEWLVRIGASVHWARQVQVSPERNLRLFGYSAGPGRAFIVLIEQRRDPATVGSRFVRWIDKGIDIYVRPVVFDLTRAFREVETALGISAAGAMVPGETPGRETADAAAAPAPHETATVAPERRNKPRPDAHAPNGEAGHIWGWLDHAEDGKDIWACLNCNDLRTRAVPSPCSAADSDIILKALDLIGLQVMHMAKGMVVVEVERITGRTFRYETIANACTAKRDPRDGGVGVTGGDLNGMPAPLTRAQIEDPFTRGRLTPPRDPLGQHVDVTAEESRR